jgi:DNA-binding transcriptional regulator YbjK
VKPPLVLLDANIIIEAHALGVWNTLIASFEVTVPAIVARHEAKYFVVKGQHNPIQLASLVAQNKVKELQADLRELSELMNQFDPLFSESIDPGEQEALALMLAGRCPEHRFCSADARPLQALAMLDMSDRGVALEELLNRVGQSKRLDEQYTKAYLDRQIREGQRRRIQGDGLSWKSKFQI